MCQSKFVLPQTFGRYYSMNNIERNMERLGITLPELCSTNQMMYSSYDASHVVARSILYVSGQLSRLPSGVLIAGKVGDELTLEQGQEAAQFCLLNVLAHLKKACDGKLSRIKRCIKLTGYVNSCSTFNEHRKVLDGAPTLVLDLFGKEAGRHARSVVGAASLPDNAAMEVDAIFEVSIPSQAVVATFPETTVHKTRSTPMNQDFMN